MGVSLNHPIPQNMDDWMRLIERRIITQERREPQFQVEQRLGPGLARFAHQVWDWNTENTWFTGHYWSDVGSLNSPDPERQWIGLTRVAADNGGVQELVTTDGSIRKQRWFTFDPDNTTALPTFGDWVDYGGGGGGGGGAPSGPAGGDLTGYYPNPDIRMGAVGNAELADDAVTSAKIMDGTIQNGDMGTGSVDARVIADNTITTTEIADGTITEADMAAGVLPNVSVLDEGTSLTARLRTLNFVGPGVTATGGPDAITVAVSGDTGTYFGDMPVGAIAPWGAASPPTGWLLANGQSLLRTGVYQPLYNVIGTTFGAVDSDHFNVPNLNNKVPLMGVLGLGQTDGRSSVQLTTNELPNHWHDMSHIHGASVNFSAAQNTATQSGGQDRITSLAGGGVANVTVGGSPGTTGPAGGGAPFSIQNPFLALNYIIKAVPSNPGGENYQPGVALALDASTFTFNVLKDDSTISVDAQNRLYVPNGGITSLQIKDGTITPADQSGIAFKQVIPVRVADTGNLTSLSGLQVVDGIQTVTGDRVLVRSQNVGTENGVYVAAAGAWTRAADADTAAEVAQTTTVRVFEGNQNKGKVFTQIEANPAANPQNWRVVTFVDPGNMFTWPGPQGTGHMFFDANRSMLIIWDGFTWAKIGYPIITTSTARPSSPIDGMEMYETDTGKSYIYWNGAWQAVGGGAPAAHHITHEPGGSDPMAVDAAPATGSLRTLGSGAQQAAAGAHTHSGLAPGPHHTTHEPGGSDAMAVDAAAAVGSLRTLGLGGTSAASGNHAHLWIQASWDQGTNPGYFVPSPLPGTNSPDGSNYWGIVHGNGTDIIQHAYQISGTKEWIRFRISGVWSAWTRVDIWGTPLNQLAPPIDWVNANYENISNVADPSSPQDAANMRWVQSQVARLGQTLTSPALVAGTWTNVSHSLGAIVRDVTFTEGTTSEARQLDWRVVSGSTTQVQVRCGVDRAAAYYYIYVEG